MSPKRVIFVSILVVVALGGGYWGGATAGPGAREEALQADVTQLVQELDRKQENVNELADSVMENGGYKERFYTLVDNAATETSELRVFLLGAFDSKYVTWGHLKFLQEICPQSDWTTDFIRDMCRNY